MKVLRVYHGGRDEAHRERDRALVRAGAEVLLVVPSEWPGPDVLKAEPFEMVSLGVRRAGDVNRHRFADPAQLTDLVERFRPAVLDLHEEPFSVVVRQVLRRVPSTLPVVGYTAQNMDKRFPPPFDRWERAALARSDGLYPCSRQAASVAVGKGFRGTVRVLPLAPPTGLRPGDQDAPTDELRLLLVGRLVPGKGVLDAVRVLAAIRRHCHVSLTLVGEGPEAAAAQQLAAELGVGDALALLPWLDAQALAEQYRAAHVLLAPSRTLPTWVEQFGRMAIEAQAAGAVVVGYASGALPEVVGTAGVLVAEGDVDALAREVLGLHYDPSRWRALRDAGLAAVAPRSWDAVAAGQLELYRAVTGSPVARPRRLRAQRARAVAEYGAPARLTAPGRPFALPVLRADTAATRALATIIDRAARRAAVEPPERLRVVYVDHVARLSGGEIALERLLAALPDVDAHVVLAEDGPLRPRLERLGVRVEILPLAAGTRDASRTSAGLRTALGLAGYTLRLARRLRALRPDLVHTNSLKSGYYGSLAARLAGVPVVWHLRDRVAEDYLPSRAVRITRTALRFVPDLVLCNSAETASTLGTRTPALVVHDPYAPTRAPRAHSGDRLVVGMVGRIAGWKGQDVLLRAAARVPGVQVRICGAPLFGEDDCLVRLRGLVAELGLSDRVDFVGFVEDVEGELARLDILVHASTLPEPFGQVVVEGMAAGLAVVAADAGGPREIITPNVDGLLSVPGDAAALAEALLRLRDPDLRRRLGTAAAVRAQDFAPEVVGRDVHHAYRAVVAVSGRRRGPA